MILLLMLYKHPTIRSHKLQKLLILWNRPNFQNRKFSERVTYTIGIDMIMHSSQMKRILSYVDLSFLGKIGIQKCRFILGFDCSNFIGCFGNFNHALLLLLPMLPLLQKG